MKTALVKTTTAERGSTNVRTADIATEYTSRAPATKTDAWTTTTARGSSGLEAERAARRTSPPSARALRTRAVVNIAAPDARKRRVWTYNSVELWDLLVDEPAREVGRWGRWVGQQLIAALL